MIHIAGGFSLRSRCGPPRGFGARCRDDSHVAWRVMTATISGPRNRRCLIMAFLYFAFGELRPLCLMRPVH